MGKENTSNSELILSAKIRRGEISIDENGRVVIANPALANAVAELAKIGAASRVNLCFEGATLPGCSQLAGCSIDVCPPEKKCGLTDPCGQLKTCG